MSKKTFLIIVLIGLLSMSIPVMMTQAQCVVRTDWPIHIVQPGETLFRISQRYGTDTATLMAANCLVSTRIDAYQTLHVPPSGQPGPGPIGRVVTIFATYQPFEGGFMVWSSDSSAISAFIVGQARLRSFAARTYSGWPGPLPGTLAPINRYVPQLGFGKVWYTASGMSAALGWATAPEQGYMMTVNYNTSNRVTSFSLPGGQYLINNFNGTWSYGGVPPVITPPPPPPPIVTPTPYLEPNPPSVGFTFQPFDGGFMVWRADSSEIYAYIYSTSELFVFPGSVYGRLPINYSLVPPPGRIRPDNGFGRVWSNYGNIRAALGWAQTGEQGYLSLVQRFNTGQTYSFTLPDGRTVTRINDRLWTIL